MAHRGRRKKNNAAQGISLDEANAQLSLIVTKLAKEDYHEFAHYLQLLADELSQPTPEEEAKEKTLDDIRSFLREKLPPNAIATSEKTHLPATFTGCTPQNTLHVDSFLFPDDDVIDEYCDKGILQRFYCKECSARNVQPLEFISHSMSASEGRIIFTHILPNLAGKTVVDIGSRLGTVLYCGFLYSKAFTIIGVEFNKELVELQTEVITKFGMNKRIKICGEDIRNCANMLKDADVVIMNNVFDAFIQPDELPALWEFVLNSIGKPGALLVADPGLEKAMTNAKISKETQDKLLSNFTEITIHEKLEPLFDDNEELEEELSDLKVYERAK